MKTGEKKEDKKEEGKEKKEKKKVVPPFDIIDGDADEVLNKLNSFDHHYHIKIHEARFDLESYQWIIFIEKRQRVDKLKLVHSPQKFTSFMSAQKEDKSGKSKTLSKDTNEE